VMASGSPRYHSLRPAADQAPFPPYTEAWSSELPNGSGATFEGDGERDLSGVAYHRKPPAPATCFIRQPQGAAQAESSAAVSDRADPSGRRTPTGP